MSEMTVTDARSRLSEAVDTARVSHEPVYLLRRGRRVAALIGRERGADQNGRHRRRPRAVGGSQGRTGPGVTFAVQLAPAAVRQLRKLPPNARRRIRPPSNSSPKRRVPQGPRKLSGSSDDWRVRTGGYRII